MRTEVYWHGSNRETIGLRVNMPGRRWQGQSDGCLQLVKAALGRHRGIAWSTAGSERGCMRKPSRRAKRQTEYEQERPGSANAAGSNGACGCGGDCFGQLSGRVGGKSPRQPAPQPPRPVCRLPRAKQVPLRPGPIRRPQLNLLQAKLRQSRPRRPRRHPPNLWPAAGCTA